LKAALQTIRSHLAWVEVRGGPEGARVEVDGRDAGPLPLDAPVRVRAGDVVLRVTAPGYAPTTRTLTLRPGARGREAVQLVPAAPDPARRGPSEPRGGGVLFSVPARPTVLVEAGYSALPRVTYLAPLGRAVALGARLGLDAWLFHTFNEDYRGTLTVNAGVPLHFALVDNKRVALSLAVTPGLGLTVLDYTNILGAQDTNLTFDITGEYLAVLLDGRLDLGFRLTPRITLGGGVEVPAAFFFGGGTELEELLAQLGLFAPEPEAFSAIPLLFGPAFEWRASDGFALAAKLRMGPHVLSGDLPEAVSVESSRVDFGLMAQVGFIFVL